MSNNNIIEDGSKVIIKRDSFLRFEVVSRRKKVEMHKLNFFLENAIGHHYGSTFEVKDKQLSVKPTCNSTVSESKPTTTSGENNQFIIDDGQSQKMSKDEIMALKAKGVAGEKIIDQLIENSKSFDQKTEFSQEKYLKKKKKRHSPEVTILKPTLSLICEMLYTNSPGKIMDLRMDTVSQILTMANIQSNTNVMLLENTQSFLAGVILHRMGGMGNLIQIYNGDCPVRICLPFFDLQKEHLNILSGFPMDKINTLEQTSIGNKDTITQLSSTITKDCANTPLSPPDCEKTLVEAMDTSDSNTKPENNGDIETKSHDTQDNEDINTKLYCTQHNEDNNTKSHHKPKALTTEEKLNRKKNRDDEEKKVLGLLKKNSMDSLVIATKFHSKTALMRLLEFLAPSRPFVVYSPYKEVLVECYVALKALRNTLLLNLTETWWRSYQVLPKRTHPQIMMDGSGGYLLTGIKVDQGEIEVKTEEKSTSETPTKKTKIDQEEVQVKPEEKDSSESPTKKTKIDQREPAHDTNQRQRRITANEND